MAGAWAAAPAAAASLRGAVIEHSSGRPLARAQVTLDILEGAGAGRSETTLTDSRGQYEFTRLPGGTYRLSAERKGYARARYGQARWDLPGTPIVLGAEGHFVAELRLKRLGAVSGEVTDENQVGLSEYPVYAYRVGKRLKVAAIAQTDDRGIYRLAGLEPGRYVIRTAAKRLEGGRELLPTYHGQTVSAREARAVDVDLEEERPAVNIEPLPGRLGRLQGLVTGPGAGVASVALHMDTGRREAAVGVGSSFAFDQLAPGEYELMAEATVGEARYAGYQKVQVGGGETRTVLEMGPAPAVRIDCRELRGGPLDGRAVSIFMRRKDLEEAAERLSCGGTVVARPGVWEMAAAAPANLYVAAVLDARKGEEAHEFTLGAGENRDLTVLFSARPAGLRGKVRTADGGAAIGAPVYLQALEADVRVRLGGVRTARADQNGEYRFQGLPPGRYELLSTFEIRDAGEADWRAGVGRSVTVGEGEEGEVDLELSGVR